MAAANNEIELILSQIIANTYVKIVKGLTGKFPSEHKITEIILGFLNNMNKQLNDKQQLHDRKTWTEKMHSEYNTFEMLFKKCFSDNVKISQFYYTLQHTSDLNTKKQFIISNFNTVTYCRPMFAYKLQRKLMHETFIEYDFIYDETIINSINTINSMHHNPQYIKQLVSITISISILSQHDQIYLSQVTVNQ